jgi:glucan endo-1,3-alpha-glucosidase
MKINFTTCTSGWLVLTAYYAQAFKTGVYPTIERDRVVMWARPHPRDAQASEDTVKKPTNFELVLVIFNWLVFSTDIYDDFSL